MTGLIGLAVLALVVFLVWPGPSGSSPRAGLL